MCGFVDNLDKQGGKGQDGYSIVEKRGFALGAQLRRRQVSSVCFFNRLRGGYARPHLLKGRLRAGYAVRVTPREATRGRFYCRGRLRGAYA